MNFHVIGIDDNREQSFSEEVASLITSHTVFSGGVRHHEIMRPYLPAGYEWIDITVPLDDVFRRYEAYDDVIVFASGDPLFFGFANTIRRKMPDAGLRVYPFFNSLQLLAHRLLSPYHDMHVVSLTGRSWNAFDEALILGYGTIGLLTDKKQHTPRDIAARMLEYGYDNYTMSIGELLGNKEQERVITLSIQEAAQQSFAFPNCIMLRQTARRARPFGIPDAEFHLLNGRAKMITKMPVRLVTLHALDLRDRNVFWDIGFCTGSVSIEARMQFPHLKVYAFEKRTEGAELMAKNSRRFGVPGIETFIGDFTEIDISMLPPPDAVFLGGHGGQMKEIIGRLEAKMPRGAVVVFNSVSEASRALFLESLDKERWTTVESIAVRVDDFNRIEVMRCKRK